MGILDKTHNISQYTATTNLPSDFLSTVVDKVKLNSFVEIDRDSAEDYSCGWVSHENILDTEFESISFIKEPYIVLGFRIDKRAVPASVVKRYILQKENEIMKNENLEVLPKQRKADIAEAIKLNLLKKTEPTTQVCDFVWNMKTGNVIFTNVSPKICDGFQEYFYETFDIRLALNELSMIGGEILDKNGADDELIEDFKYRDFAGADFLTWLWHVSEGSGSVFNNDDIMFDGKVTLVNYDLDSKETVTCVGNSQGMQEIRTAIESDKRITQSKFIIVNASGEFSFVLDAAYFDFRSLKPPKVQIEFKEDPDGFFYEKIYLIESVITTLNNIYTEFVLSILKGEK